MAEETKMALAALFRMRGRDTMSESEFVLDASMKLRWFSPKDAQRFLQIGVDSGLLSSSEGNVRPTFDPRELDIPANYRPGPEVLAAPPKARDLFARLLERIGAATGEESTAIVARVNRVQGSLGVDLEVAAAFVAMSSGLDVSDVLPEVEEAILRRAR